MTNDIDIYPSWYHFKYHNMRQTDGGSRIVAAGEIFIYLGFFNPINFEI